MVIGDVPLRVLTKKATWVVVIDFNRFLKAVSATPELDDRLLQGKGVARSPIGGRIHEQSLGRVLFTNIHCTAGARWLPGRVSFPPNTRIQNRFDGLFLDMIDPYPVRIHVHSRQDFENGLGTMGLVGKMRRMNKDELTIFIAMSA